MVFSFLCGVLLVLFFFCTKISADTPANCMYEEIRGSWLFSVGQGGHDNTIDCSKEFSVVSKLRVDLLFPDIAVDENGNQGFWTMIYNQGFEVVINEKKYFAFSAYKKSDSAVTSVCDQTFNGWSHDAAKYKPGNWACCKGKKVSDIQPSKKQKLKPLSTLRDRKFIPNHDFVDQINSVQSSWKAGVYGEYKGMTMEQIMRRAGGAKKFDFPKTSKLMEEQVVELKALPEEFDWRNVGGRNYVSPVRNQRYCGSCFAFSTLGMFEARVRILSNGTKIPVFSTQDIVSCSEYSQGCEGGFPYLIGKYAEDFGLVDESCFPYEGRDMPCQEKKCSARQFGTGYHYIGGFYGACNEALMRAELVKNGPIVVTFQLYDDFINYKSGIYHHTGLEDKVNPFEPVGHSVLAVGYGADKKTGEKFWIAKNSWGEDWGEDGYVRIRRGTDECSIESIAVSAEPVLN